MLQLYLQYGRDLTTCICMTQSRSGNYIPVCTEDRGNCPGEREAGWSARTDGVPSRCDIVKHKSKGVGLGEWFQLDDTTFLYFITINKVYIVRYTYLYYNLVNTSCNLSNNTLISSSLPTVTLKHPSHPNSPPLYLTTTFSSSAIALYTFTALVLSGRPLLSPSFARIGNRTKFASFPPIGVPMPRKGEFWALRVSREERSLAREERRVEILSFIFEIDDWESAESASWPVGEEML